MKVIITKPDNSTYECQLEQDLILVGRSKNCDLIIESDHVSRKHLEIKKLEGNIFIKDLTLSNWISYNDEKLEKNTDIQYFDFAPLELPGGFKLKIDDNSEGEDLTVSSMIKESARARSGGKKVPNRELNAEKEIKKERRSIATSSSETGAKNIGILVVVVLIFVFAFYFLVGESELSAPPITQATQKSEKPRRKVKPKIQRKVVRKKTKSAGSANKQKAANTQVLKTQKEFGDYISRKNKCRQGYVKRICERVFNNRLALEGIVEERFTLHVLKNYRVRTEAILNNNYQKVQKAMKTASMQAFVAGDQLLRPSVLKEIESMGIKKVRVYLYRRQAQGNKLLRLYDIDPGIHRRLSQSEIEYANQAVRERVDYKAFEQKFLRFLVPQEIPLK